MLYPLWDDNVTLIRNREMENERDTHRRPPGSDVPRPRKQPGRFCKGDRVRHLSHRIRKVIDELGADLLVVWPRAATPEHIADAKRCGLHVRCGFADDMSYEEAYEVFKRMVDMGVDEVSCGRPDWIGRMIDQYGDESAPRGIERIQSPMRSFHLIHMDRSFEKGIVAPREDAALLKRLHGNMGWFMGTGCAAGWGHKMTYDTSRFERLSGIGDADLLEQYIGAARSEGLQAIVYLNLHWYRNEFGAEHADWEQRTVEGRAIGQVRPLYGKGTSFCVNSGWRDWSFDLIREVAQYDIDGVFLDGPVVYPDCCFCTACQAKFRQLYGETLPAEENWNDPCWKEFVLFRQDSMAAYLREARQALKSIKEKAILYLNSGNWNSDWRAPRDIQYLVDYQDITGVEAFFSTPLERQKFLYYSSASAKYVQAVGKPSTIFFTTWQSPWENFANTPTELEITTAEVAANGSSPWVAILDETLEGYPEALEPIGEIYGFLERNEEFYARTESAANVALWCSMQTRFFYCSRFEEFYRNIGTGNEADLQIDLGDGAVQMSWKAGKQASEDEALESFQGFFDALTRVHIPFDLVVDRSISPEGLAPYDVLVMPNVACLSEGQAETIRAFVEGGGGLIATFETSLYDEQGEPRGRFLLEELFRVEKPEGMFAQTKYDSMIVKEKHGAMPSAEVGMYIPRPARVMKTRATAGACVPMKVMEPLDNVITSIKGESVYSGLVVSSYGRGKVIYSPADLGRHYYEQRMIPHLKLLGGGVRWLLGARALIEVEAPGTVEVVVRTQKERGRTLIHLINLTGEMQRPIEQVIPLYDIALKVKTPGARRVYALGEQGRISFREDGRGWISLMLSRLDLYEIVVVETEGEQEVAT